ncbi:MAG: hypothetical protein JJU42_16535 [Rhodobacteraceae bacterium]|nr:hypothetical protein [Paracoccaceae bacterium]
MQTNRNLRLSVSVAALFYVTGAVAQDMPRGGAATGCNPDTFSPVISERTGETLYWNNPNCPAGSGSNGGAGELPPVDEEDEEEEEPEPPVEPYS